MDRKQLNIPFVEFESAGICDTCAVPEYALNVDDIEEGILFCKHLQGREIEPVPEEERIMKCEHYKESA